MTLSFKTPLTLYITATHSLQKHFNFLLWLELLENNNENKCLKAATDATNVAEGPHRNWKSEFQLL